MAKIDPRKKTMTKKAYKAELAKKRNQWTCARPEGFRLSNRKAYSRAERKASTREFSFAKKEKRCQRFAYDKPALSGQEK